jgi:hypothetical protein
MAATALRAVELSRSGIVWLRKSELPSVGKNNWKRVFVAASDN